MREVFGTVKSFILLTITFNQDCFSLRPKEFEDFISVQLYLIFLYFGNCTLYLFTISQSDWESASEVEDRYSQLEHINKESLYEAYRKVYNRYNKTKNKYQELVTHYRQLEKEKEKARVSMLLFEVLREEVKNLIYSYSISQ